MEGMVTLILFGIAFLALLVAALDAMFQFIEDVIGIFR